jgi:hypothetical protein
MKRWAVLILLAVGTIALCGFILWVMMRLPII